MDTTTFLRRVLPQQGVYVFSVIRPHPTEPRTSTANVPCASIEAMAAQILAVDRNPAYNVYHACASFEDGTLPPHAGLRRATNAAWVRSQWIDIDVDPDDPKKYPTRNAAVQAIKAFCAQRKLNAPLIVSSGKGLHAYWVFEEDVPAAQAKQSALAFKHALDEAEVLVDQHRTADLSSILRPPGTHWRKDGELEVKVVHEGVPMAYATFCARLSVAPTTSATPAAEPTEWETGPKEYPPSSAHEVVKHCRVLQGAREVGGAVPEPLWRAMLGLLKHTVEGEGLAHEWSQGDPRYDRAQTQDKLDRWLTGPPTCVTIRGSGGACGDCPHHTKKSPICLGVYEAPPQPPVETAPDETPALVDLEKYVNKLPHELAELGVWNNRYQYLNGSLGVVTPDPDGGASVFTAFVLKYVYPYTYIRREDGTYEVGFCAYTKSSDRWERFNVPTEYLSDLRKLGGALASHKVYVTGKGGLETMRAYMLDLLNHIEADGIEARQVGRFGWTEDGFVLGNTLITKDGAHPVVLGEGVPRVLKEGFETKGSVADAVASLLGLYDRPGAEMMQFVLYSAFASPLIKLLDAELFHGIPIGLTGASGQGKTTTAMIACSIYGKPRSMLMNASDMGTTTNAMIQMNATAAHLPIIFDELHAMKEADLPTLLYALSNGAPKFRLRSDSGFNETGAKWDNVTFVTSNANISAELANQERNKAEATQLRLWEIDIQHGELERIFDTAESKARVEHHLANYYGALGQEWIRYVVENKEKIATDLLKARALHVPNTQEMNRERFYYDHKCVVSVVHKHTKRKFGLTFSWENIERWIDAHIKRMREARQRNLASFPEQLDAVVQATVGRVVTSRVYTHRRQNEKEIVDEQRVRDPIARHYTEDGVLMISWRGFNEICRDLRLSPHNLLEELERHRLVKDQHWLGVDKRGRVALFKGTTLPTAYTQTRVVAVDLHASQAMDQLSALPEQAPLTMPRIEHASVH